jgi:hypothetical protein
MVLIPALVVLPLLLAATAPQPSQVVPPDLKPLVQALQRHGFRVRLEPPPRRGVYGLFDSRSRTLWVAPLSFALGIGRQTLLHEAAHAVQSCPHGQLRPVGWRLPLATVVRQEIEGITFTAYGHGNREVEREAFALQAQPNAVTLLLKGLAMRCKRQT